MKRKKSPYRGFSDKDTALLRELKAANLDTLDEDELADLHRRVRRARAKHTKNYRRAAAERVHKAGSRGAARPSNLKAAQRAERFERALAKVSGRLAAAARRSADALRAERLDTARRHKGSPIGDGGVLTGSDDPAPPPRLDDRRPETPQRRKRNAHVKASGARRQARRDGR